MWASKFTARLLAIGICVNLMGAAAALVIGKSILPSDGVLGYAHYPIGRIFGNLHLLDIARGIHVQIASGIPLVQPLAWSPDGTQLAFAELDGNDYEIYLLDLMQHRPDGRRARPLTENEDQDLHPAWSPDGSQVVFQAFRGGHYDLYAVNVRNGHETQLNDQQDYEYAPVWSPDGRYIAYAGIPAGRGYGLYALDLMTMRVSYLADLPERSYAVWAPNGAHLLFSPIDRSGVYRVDLGSNDPVELSDSLHPGQIGGRAAWSPDSNRIAVVSDHEGGSWVYILSADGTGLRRVTFGVGLDAAPAWIP
jgi:Tol biopolymer transport system component